MTDETNTSDNLNFKDFYGSFPPLTLGVEMELLTVESLGLDLVHSDLVIKEFCAVFPHLQKQIDKEFHSAILELRSAPHYNLSELRIELTEHLSKLLQIAADSNIALLSSATHPFADWEKQSIRGGTRYERLIANHPWMRMGPITSLHIHVSMPSFDDALRVQNLIRYFIPHFLALSTNSPFFDGRKAGAKSERFRLLLGWNSALTEIPPILGTPQEYLNYLAMIKKTGAIQELKDAWLLVRCRPDLGTLEFRVMDIPSTLDAVLSITALFQALVAQLWTASAKGERITQILNFPHKWIELNLHNAATSGLESHLIEPSGEPRHARESLRMLVDSVSTNAKALSTLQELHGISDILERGTGADLQLRDFDRTHSLQAVVAAAIGRFQGSIGLTKLAA